MKAVNLLPPDQRGAGKPASAVVATGDEATGRVGAFALLGALAFCVVALAAYVLVGNTVKDRRAQLDEVSAQAATVTARANQLKPYADFAAQAAERVQTVKDLAASRFDWEQALRDISRVVPPSVTLAKLDGSISESSGGSGLRSAIAAPAVELTGCTTGGQVAVAQLLSRLRDVDGVTRVSLAKSDKPDVAASTVAAPGSTTGTGCGPRRAPQFDVIVFFEHSQVPATLDDVAGGSSTTTSASASTSTASAPAATPSPAPTTPSNP